MTQQTYRHTVTVLTPSYERAHTLPRTYQSLQKQTFRDFEWVVVDDGSTDNTGELVKGWRDEADFPLKYIYQDNAGKESAVNTGLQAVDGRFVLVLDSDDYLVPEALERFIDHWENIPDQRRDEFAGVRALSRTEDGQIVGTEYPDDVVDAHTYRMRYEYSVKGDKQGIIRTDLYRQHPYPVYEGERHVPPSASFRPIFAEYKNRHVNEALVVVEYQPGGLTAMGDRRKFTSPMGLRYYQLQLIRYPDRPSVLKHLQNYAKYVRYSIHAGVGLRTLFADVPSKLLLTVACPAGILIYLDDVIRRIPGLDIKSE